MTTVKIKGMSCQHCVASVTGALQGLAGITDVKVDLQSGSATFSGNAEKSAIKKAIEQIGFELVD